MAITPDARKPAHKVFKAISFPLEFVMGFGAFFLLDLAIYGPEYADLEKRWGALGGILIIAFVLISEWLLVKFEWWMRDQGHW